MSCGNKFEKNLHMKLEINIDTIFAFERLKERHTAK